MEVEVEVEVEEVEVVQSRRRFLVSNKLDTALAVYHPHFCNQVPVQEDLLFMFAPRVPLNKKIKNWESALLVAELKTGCAAPSACPSF